MRGDEEMGGPGDGDLGYIRESYPHYSDEFGEHYDIDFVNPKHGYGQQILPYPRIHIDSLCQPDFDETPDSGW